jgi:rhomboid protease GluP
VLSAGASGAVFGIFGALAAFSMNRENRHLGASLEVLRKDALGFIGANLVLGFMIPGIDYAAHIGGAVAGFAFGILWNPPLTLGARSPARLQMRAATLALVLGAWALLLASGMLSAAAAPGARGARSAAISFFHPTRE